MKSKLNNEWVKVKREKSGCKPLAGVPMITKEGAVGAMHSQRHFL
jgi:hypothetical protein